MFSNLIESSSHRGEFRRRGSFLVFTTASYVVLFVIAGVVSIYAYDARMDDRSLELVTMMPLVDLPAPPAPITNHQSPPSNPKNPVNNDRNAFQRKIAMADVNEPTIAPDKVSTTANVYLPLPKNGVVEIGNRDSEPGSGNPGNGTGGQAQRNSALVVAIETPPPPPVVQNAVPKVLKKSVPINGDAIFLPKPPYPEMARQMKIQGPVNVQVLIDEAGKVISAKAVSGHPLLAREAQRAALQVRFSPTVLGDQPVKVSGVITYNFVLQQ